MHSIPSLHKYQFKGGHFVYRRFTLTFILLCLTLVAVSALLPDNASSTSSSTDRIRSGLIPQEKVVPKAEVLQAASYIRTVNPNLSDTEVRDFAEYSVDAAKTFKHDLAVFLALVTVESRFNPEAVSPKGAMGLTQVIPKWHLSRIEEARKLFGVYSIYEPKLNLYVGASALREFIKVGRNLQDGLLLYNGSLTDESKVYAKLVMAEAYQVRVKFLNPQKV